MARTFNRRPMSVNGPDKDSIKNYTFNYEQWKGINDSKDFLAVDQLTFSDAQNMYIDSEGLLSSRPAIKKAANIANSDFVSNIEYYNEFRNDIKNTTIRAYWLHYIADKSTLYIEDDALATYRKIDYVYNTREPKYIDAYKYLYVFGKSQLMPMIVYNKSTLEFLTPEEIKKLVYIPVTKTFTGSVENEGEGINQLTTSERYLYYYSDANGINSDAIGKTLEWDGKTINWNDNVKPFLVKDHYDVGDSNVMAVAPSGAVAWVENNVLYYAVNGAIVYSWDLTNLATATSKYKVSFNVSSNTIIVSIDYKAYLVSCVSAKEDGSLAIPTPTLLTSVTGFAKYDDFVVTAYYYIDESQYVYAVREAEGDLRTTYICYNFGEADTRYEKDIGHDSTQGNINAIADGAVMNADSVVVTYSSVESNVGKRKFIIIRKSSPTAIDRTDIYEGISSLSFDNCLLQLSIDSYLAYLPKIGTTDSAGKYQIAGIYCFKNQLYGNDAAVVDKHGVGTYTFGTQVPDSRLKPVYDNILKVSLNQTMYDFTKTEFSTATSVVVSEKALDGMALESTTTVYNYYKAVNGSNHIFTRFSNDTFELYYTKQGYLNDFFVFDLLYLNNYFFAVGNKLYITENKYDDDGQFLFYLPKKNVNEFDNVITKLHQIDESTVAVFFEDEIYYTTYDSDVGTYRYYKSKLQFGLRKGANVITSDDSVTTFFPTDRGIMALTYQNFVASSEQSTTPISDPVFNYMKDFLTGKVVKLYKKEFWIAAYNGSNTVWILDIRNGSWWRQEVPGDLTDVWTRNNEPWLNLGVPYNIVKDGVYTDDDKHINWFFQSQKLHLSALNYYKSVQALTFFGVSDDSVCIFNLDTYAYRDNIYENVSKNIEYGINMIRTYLYHLHVMKLHEFQFKVYADTSINDPDLIHPIKLSNVAVRYRVSREVR